MSQSSQKAGLIRGSQVLNERFLNMWAKDGHRDYLAPPVVEMPTGAAVMKKLLSSMGAAAAGGEEDNNADEDGGIPGTPLPPSRAGRPVLAPPTPQQQYCIDIDVDQQVSRDAHGSHTPLHDAGDGFGDDRITAAKLKRLLQMRPDITKLLSDCIIESEIE
jgi:hypothetical protein